MVWIYAAIILAAVVFTAAGFTVKKSEFRDSAGNLRQSNARTWRINKKSFLALLPLLLIIGGCVTSIPAGHTGVVVTFGKVEDKILTEGLHNILPYQSVIIIDNRVQKRSFEFAAFSSDIQQTNVVGSINFTVDKTHSQSLYQAVGVTYYDTVILPRVVENIKLIFSGYSAEGLIESRTLLSKASQSLIVAELAPYGITVVSVNLEDIDFTDTFTDAVESKQVAQQNKLATQTQQEAEIIIANAEAEKKVIAAEADAQTKKIAADANAYAVKIQAEAEAEANLKVALSLTGELIQYTEIQNWDGSLPEVVGSENIFPLYNIGEETAAGAATE